MRKIFSLLLLATGLALTSCEKDNNINSIEPAETIVSPSPNGRLLLSWADPYNTYNFQYNPDKTIKSYTYNNSNLEVGYPPNKMILTEYAGNQKKAYFELDLVKGIAQKQTRTFYDANGAITNVFTTVYTYNDKGLIVDEVYAKNGSLSGSMHLSYNNSNDVVLTETRDANGVIIAKNLYEYDLSLKNNFGSYGQFHAYATGSVFPKKSQHLISKQTVINNNGTQNFFVSYTVDGSGYPLTGTSKNDNGDTVNSWTYSWQ